MSKVRKKYLVVGGRVISRWDGDVHYVSPQALCGLYKVHPDECEFVTEDEYETSQYRYDDNLIVLRPRYDGNYELEEN